MASELRLVTRDTIRPTAAVAFLRQGDPEPLDDSFMTFDTARGIGNL